MNIISAIRYPGVDQAVNIRMKGRPWIFVYLSDWCPACQEYKPIVEYLAAKYERQVPVYVMRPEDHLPLPEPLTGKTITSIPYSVFLLGNTVLAEVPGAMRFFDFESAMKTLHKSFAALE